MKNKIKSALIGFVVFCIIFYLGKFILYKLNYVDSWNFDIATVVGFAIGWFLAEFIMYKLEKKK